MKLTIYLLSLLILGGSFLLYTLKTPRPTDTQLANSLAGKAVLICGASSGIGEELAYQLADFGAQLVLVGRREERLKAVREEALSRGALRVEILPFDFSDAAGSGIVIEQTIGWLGRLDYLVINHAAIIGGPHLAYPHQQDPHFVERIFRVNTLSYLQLFLHALPHLEESHGHVFVTSSIAGEVPGAVRSSILYHGTKHALNGLFYSLQAELFYKESNVTISVGALGFIFTKELGLLLENAEIPSWMVGDLHVCARLMTESYLTRPLTLTYPAMAGYLARALWYFHPRYVERVSSWSGMGHGKERYDRFVNVERGELRKKAKEMDYQQGYNPTEIPSR